MPPSTHDDPGDIRADTGPTDTTHSRTVSHTSDLNGNQPPTTKRFCTFAVDTGLTHSPGLPEELRLMVYKAAFPEMNRPVYEKDPYTRTSLECQTPCGLEWYRECFLPERNGWNDRLRRAFTSNFARDPTTRIEFLTEYLHRVQISKETESHTDSTKGDLSLWRLLSLLAKSGLVGEMKHLVFEPDPDTITMGPMCVEQGSGDASIGRTLAVLFHFRVKCELTFMMIPPVYKPILDRMTEIVKANISRDEIDKYFTSSCADPHHDKYFKETAKIFSDDAVFSELIDRLQLFLLDSSPLIDFYPYDHPVLRYPIDFSE
ncbi:hypothetical protein yc1106_03481 [Curvularia clavata]|uniref:Uncharacterized protein n=1 Tax=Curvularia clavata TaxID=95742 RepID=A0A9Q9DR29_CURCL|nr:hypothetical protein yc1106_03481 [Curvularia clavata]